MFYLGETRSPLPLYPFFLDLSSPSFIFGGGLHQPRPNRIVFRQSTQPLFPPRLPQHCLIVEASPYTIIIRLAAILPFPLSLRGQTKTMTHSSALLQPHRSPSCPRLLLSLLEFTLGGRSSILLASASHRCAAIYSCVRGISSSCHSTFFWLAHPIAVPQYFHLAGASHRRTAILMLASASHHFDAISISAGASSCQPIKFLACASQVAMP